MTVMVGSSSTSTQTATVSIDPAWGSCSISYSISPTPTSFSHSLQSDGNSILVTTATTNDLSLIGTTQSFTVNVVPDFQDGDSLPASASYTFNVNFGCDVTSLSFLTVIPD